MSPKLRIAIIALLTVIGLRAFAQTSPAAGSKEGPKRTIPPPDLKQETIPARVEKYLRNLYAWGPAYDVKVGEPKPSLIPGLLQVPVTVSLAGHGDTVVVYVNESGTVIIQGELAEISVDPFADVRAKLRVGNSPSMGPENAKVTLIEFADFECPSCRQLDRTLRELVPNHPEIRLVFKHFPLTQIHPWAMTAAIASQCTYQQNPAAFWKMHDDIFDTQDSITPSNVLDKMKELAAKQALNMDVFQACVSNPETTNQVEENIGEGRALNVTGTPTTFINGRRLVGNDRALLEQYIRFETTQY